jgi:hypothetical protein
MMLLLTGTYNPNYKVVAGQLRRMGATTHCIVCGLPNVRGVLTFAHIHDEDLHLSPGRNPDGVFCLCWNHHHAVYDQHRISTAELIEREQIWIEHPERRPSPHPRDIEFMQRPSSGCVWTENRRRQRVVADDRVQVRQPTLFGH